jgi:hypothetical protein
MHMALYGNFFLEIRPSLFHSRALANPLVLEVCHWFQPITKRQSKVEQMVFLEFQTVLNMLYISVYYLPLKRCTRGGMKWT